MSRPAIVLFCLGSWILGGLLIWFGLYEIGVLGVLAFMLAMMMFDLPNVVGALAADESRQRDEAQPEAPTPPHDPLDPTYLLRHPPDGAQAVNECGRRVVVLADGSVIGELLSGRAQRFASLNDFREFIGS
jgi:hypothetical protein